jgi:hypothetical protein
LIKWVQEKELFNAFFPVTYLTLRSLATESVGIFLIV